MHGDSIRLSYDAYVRKQGAFKRGHAGQTWNLRCTCEARAPRSKLLALRSHGLGLRG